MTYELVLEGQPTLFHRYNVARVLYYFCEISKNVKNNISENDMKWKSKWKQNQMGVKHQRPIVKVTKLTMSHAGGQLIVTSKSKTEKSKFQVGFGEFLWCLTSFSVKVMKDKVILRQKKFRVDRILKFENVIGVDHEISRNADDTATKLLFYHYPIKNGKFVKDPIYIIINQSESRY